MAAERADTREQILKVASALLRSRGFSGFAFAHIADALGVRPAAIHYHFPSKVDLGLALIERYRLRYQRWMDEARDQRMPPLDQLQGYVRIAARFAEGGTTICPLGALEAELGAIAPEMQEAVRQTARELHAWLTDVLEQGRSAGVFRFEDAAADMATFVASALQGGLQIARALGAQHVDAVLRQVFLALGVSQDRHAAE